MKITWVYLLFFTSLCLHAQVSDTIDIPAVEYRYRQELVPLFQHQTRTYDSTALNLYSGQTLSQFLRGESHAVVKSYGPSSLSTVSFRGKAPSHTDLYWNGILINSPLVGQVDMNSIPIYVINALSIRAGNSSMQTGSGALGGSIALQNNLQGLDYFNEKSENLRISGLAEVGSYGKRSGNLSYQRALRKLNLGLAVYHEKAENDFEYLNTAKRIPTMDRQSNAEYVKWGVTGNVSFSPDFIRDGTYKDTMNLAIWYQKFSRQVPPLMPDLGVKRDENQTDNSLRIAVDYSFRKKKLTHELTLGLNAEKTDYSLYFLVPNQRPYEQFKALSDYTSAQVNYSLKTVFKYRHHLMVDFRNSVQSARYSERRSSTDFDARKWTSQLQASYLYSISQRVHTELVGNLTSHLPGEIQANGTAGIFYQPIKAETYALTLGLELGRNSHQPTLNDLYWEPGGNPDLKTEKSLEMSLPISYSHEWTGNEFELKLTPYYSQVRDWILWKPTKYRFWEPSNVRSVTSTGIESSLGWRYIAERFNSSAQATYTFSPTVETTFDGSLQIEYMQLPYIPLHQLQVSYQFYLPHLNMDFMYGLRFNGARYIDAPFIGRREVLDKYTIHDIQLSYNWKQENYRSRILFRVENLLNSEYQSIQWRPMPGRNYTLSFQINFIK